MAPWHVTTIVATSIVATSAKCRLFPTAKWQRMLDGLDLGGSTCSTRSNSQHSQPAPSKFQEILDMSNMSRHVRRFPRFGTLAETVRVSFSIASISWIQLDPVGVCQVPAQYLDQDYCITSEDPDGNWMELGFQCQILGHCMVLLMGPILVYI